MCRGMGLPAASIRRLTTKRVELVGQSPRLAVPLVAGDFPPQGRHIFLGGVRQRILMGPSLASRCMGKRDRVVSTRITSGGRARPVAPGSSFFMIGLQKKHTTIVAFRLLVLLFCSKAELKLGRTTRCKFIKQKRLRLKTTRNLYPNSGYRIPNCGVPYPKLLNSSPQTAEPDPKLGDPYPNLRSPGPRMWNSGPKLRSPGPQTGWSRTPKREVPLPSPPPPSPPVPPTPDGTASASAPFGAVGVAVAVAPRFQPTSGPGAALPALDPCGRQRRPARARISRVARSICSGDQWMIGPGSPPGRRSPRRVRGGRCPSANRRTPGIAKTDAVARDVPRLPPTVAVARRPRLGRLSGLVAVEILADAE